MFGSGCQSWFLWLFLTPFWTAFPTVVDPRVGIACGIAWFVGCPIVKLLLAKTGFGKRFIDAHPHLTTFGTGTSSGGGGRGWSGGGSGSSGGFSGGGGSFGGGGASSSW